MKKFYTLFVCLLTFASANSQTPVDLGYATLLWEDNFDYYNPNNWILVNDGDHVENKQIYRANNVQFNNGVVNLILKNELLVFNELDTIPDSWACGKQDLLTYHFSSGWMETTNPKSFGFGYLEARMKLPNNPFSSPGFWCWRNDDFPFENEAEIDILELKDSSDLNYSTTGYSTNIHTNATNSFPAYPEKNYYMEISPTNFDFTEWHVYGLEKSPYRLVWYLDGIPVRILYGHFILDDERTVFNVKVQQFANDNQVINTSMQVDYFKMYKINYNCQNDGVICGGMFPSNSYFTTLNIGNNTCANVVPIGSNLKLNAQDYIQINQNFNCPVGAELLLQTGMCH